MTKPPSIHSFENLWWGATAAWILGTILSWDRVGSTLAANPQTADAAQLAQPIIVGIVLLVTAVLWWLAARSASPAGKWLVVVAAAISALIGLGRLAGLVMGRSLHPLSLAAFLLGAVLTMAAAAALFRPDADEWFGLGEQEPLP